MVAYAGSGNFTRFVEITKKAGFSDGLRNKYFSYNLLNALAIQNVIDLFWVDNSIRWLFNETCLDSETAFGKEVFEGGDCSPAIFVNNSPLAFRKEKISSNQVEYGELDNVSNIGVVTDHVLQQEPGAISFSDSSEAFDFDSFEWQTFDGFLQEGRIIRSKRDFAGFNYFISLPKANKLYRVLEPDWLFAVSGYMCNFDFSVFFNHSESNVSLPAAFRMPLFISRFLFQNCGTLELGYKNCFVDVNSLAINNLHQYLSPRISYE